MGGIGAATLPPPHRPPAERPDRAAPSARRRSRVLDTALRVARRGWSATRCTIADLAVFGYAHVAATQGWVPAAHVAAWVERVRALPGFVADLAPYGENARPGAGRSIYD